MPSDADSAALKKSLVEEAVHVQVMTNQGAKTDLISSKLLSHILEHGSKVTVSKLSLPHTYRSVSGEIFVRCNGRVFLDRCLKESHDKILILRNVMWKISREDVKTPIIGRRVLEYIRCDNRAILETARNKLNEEIDAAKKLQERILRRRKWSQCCIFRSFRLSHP